MTRKFLHDRASARATLGLCVAAIGVSLFHLGCGELAPAELPTLDHDQFRQRAYPILLRDCAFPECHGSPDRFFQVFGPGRTRLDPETDDFDPATAAELTRSYDRTRSMLVHSGALLDAPLLLKPREGAAHEGLDAMGRNLYPDTSAPGFLELVAWARGEDGP